MNFYIKSIIFLRFEFTLEDKEFHLSPFQKKNFICPVAESQMSIHLSTCHCSSEYEMWASPLSHADCSFVFYIVNKSNSLIANFAHAKNPSFHSFCHLKKIENLHYFVRVYLDFFFLLIFKILRSLINNEENLRPPQLLLL